MGLDAGAAPTGAAQRRLRCSELREGLKLLVCRPRPCRHQCRTSAAAVPAHCSTGRMPGLQLLPATCLTMGVLPMMDVASGLIPGVGEAAMSLPAAAVAAVRRRQGACCRGAAASRWVARPAREEHAAACGRLATPWACIVRAKPEELYGTWGAPNDLRPLSMLRATGDLAPKTPRGRPHARSKATAWAMLVVFASRLLLNPRSGCVEAVSSQARASGT